MIIIFVAILLGILSHSLLQLAQCMERHGIEIYKKIFARLKKKEYEIEGGMKKPTIYLVGVALNQTPPLWAFLVGLTGAPMSYYTSVFGIGLIVTVLYSSRILNEKLQTIEYYGAAVIAIGTLLLGIDAIFRPNMSMAEVNTVSAFLFIGVIIIFGSIGMAFSVIRDSKLAIGIIFGLFSGSIGSMDPVFKGIGQNYEFSGGIPISPVGWIIFILSFGLGALAFFITQWGFSKKADASTVIPCYASAYVATPLLIQVFALPGFDLNLLVLVGLAITVIGIIMVTAFRKHHVPEPLPEIEEIPEIQEI
ncbi:MAG: hypothetical protein ACOC35_16750 [Promethearchaeia archaeon]